MKYCIVVTTLFLLAAGNSWADNVWWTGGDPVKGGSGNLWNNPQNWDPDGVPDSSDSVWIEGYSASIIPCVIDYSAPDIAWMWMQNYSAAADATLNIESSGALTVNGNCYMANNPARKAVLNINGGNLTVNGDMVIGYQNGTAELHMNDGLLDINSHLYLAFGTWSPAESTIGHIYLDGGEIHVRYHVYIENHDGGGTLEGKIFINDNGRLYIHGNYSGIVQNWITDGKLLYHGSTPEAEIRIDYPVGAETRVSVWTPPSTAYNPDPVDKFEYGATEAILFWTPGQDAVSHDVYFGTNYDDVYNATTGSDEYKGNQATNAYATETLLEGTTYYWRIDEFDGGNIFKGDVWEFTTGKLETWLTFDEGQGAVAHDFSGNNKNGSLQIDPAWSAGRIDTALDLTGTGDYVIVENTNLLMPKAITVSTWLKFQSTSPQFVIYKGGGAWALQKWPANCMQFFCVGLSPNNQVNGTIPVDDGQWHHIAAVYDGSMFSLYVDGQLDASAPATGDPTQYTSHTYNIWLGDAQDSTGYEFDGFMDEVRIYSYALSASQIASLYNNSFDANLAWNFVPFNNVVNLATNVELNWFSGENALSHDVYFGTNFDDVDNSSRELLAGDVDGSGSVDANDLNLVIQHWLDSDELPSGVSYWKFDGDTNDSAGNHHGINHGAQVVSGYENQALNFNPLFQHYVEINDDDTLDITGDLTLSARIYPERGTAFQSIIAKTQGSGATNTPFELSTTNDTLPRLVFGRADASGKETVTSTLDLTLYSWHHIIVRVENNVVDFFVDGFPTGKTGALSKTPTGNDRSLYIGRRDDGLYFDGTIDELRIFNRAVTDEEISNGLVSHITVDINGDGMINFFDYIFIADDRGKRSVFKSNTISNTFNPGQLQGGRTYYWRIDEVTALETHQGQVCQFTTIPLEAWNPTPSADTILYDLNTDLTWLAGTGALSHDIYFGTDYTAVASATTASPEFKINQTSSSYDPGLLALDTPYYWRIDERNGDGVHKGHIWSFEISDEWLFNFHGRLEWTEMITAYALQGLVNRDGAKLFIDTTGGAVHDKTIDKFWLEYLTSVKGFKFAVIDNFRDLIQLAKEKGYINGLAEYDPANIDGGEIAVACNMAAQNSLLPVTQEMLTYTSDGLNAYGTIPCFSGLSVNDIRNTWATQLAAQQYGVTNLLPNSTTDGAFWNQRLARNSTSYDYAIMANCYIMDTGTEEPQRSLTIEVLNHLDPSAPAPIFGDASIENASAGLVSEEGHCVATTTDSANLSFWAHVPYEPNSLKIGRQSSNMVLDPDKFYVVYMCNAAEMQQLINLGNLTNRQSWRDLRRGSVKVGWGITLVAAERFPGLVEYMHDTATSNDSFFCGISGYAAAYPVEMTDAQLQKFAERTELWLQETGLGFIECWGGISVYTNSLDIAEKYKGWAPSVSCFGSHRPSDGPYMDWLADGTPWAGYDDEGQANFTSADPELVTAYLEKLASENNPPFFVGLNGNNVISYAEHGRDNLDPNIFEIVNVEDFVDLMTQAAP